MSDKAGQFALDYSERAFLLVLYVPFAVRWSRASHLDMWALGLLLMETMACALVILRRHGQMNSAVGPALVAILATALPLMLLPHGAPLFPIGGPIMAIGTLWALCAKLTLNRRFGIVPANRGIQSRGQYGVIRHPIYAGYAVTHLGTLLSWPTIWNACILVAAWAAQVLRILEEERYLSLDPAYVAYSQNVRYRLIPGLF